MATALAAHQAAVAARRVSPRVHNPSVQAAVQAVQAVQARQGDALGRRDSPYAQRAQQQAALLQLPLYPTTTIGSFPQTADIRLARREHKAGRLSEADYQTTMRAEIARASLNAELGPQRAQIAEKILKEIVERLGGGVRGRARRRRLRRRGPARTHLLAEGLPDVQRQR